MPPTVLGRTRLFDPSTGADEETLRRLRAMQFSGFASSRIPEAGGIDLGPLSPPPTPVNPAKFAAQPRPVDLGPLTATDPTADSAAPMAKSALGYMPGTAPVNVPTAPPNAMMPSGGIDLGPLSPAPRPQTDLTRAFTARTPEEQQYLGLLQGGPQQHEGGAWSRIKDALLGGAYGAYASPEGHEWQGMIAGTARGAIDPQFTHNLRHNVQDVPFAKQRADESRTRADADLNRRGAFAKQYGYDPETGESTLVAQDLEQERARADEQTRHNRALEIIQEIRARTTGQRAPAKQRIQVMHEGQKIWAEYDPSTGQTTPITGPGGRGYAVAGSEKDENLSDAAKRAELEELAGAGDRGAERERRINDLRASWYQRAGVTRDVEAWASGQPNSAGESPTPEQQARAQNQIEQIEGRMSQHVEKQMEGEIKQRAAQRALKGRGASGRGGGQNKTITSDDVKAYAAAQKPPVSEATAAAYLRGQGYAIK